MLDNLLFSLNIVMPLFLLMVLGFCLRRSGFVRAEFFQYGTKIVFYIGLPLSLLRSVSSTDIEQLLDFGLIAFTAVVAIAALVVIWPLARLFIKDKGILGAFVQGSYSANVAFLGIPLLMNLGGDAGLARAALVITVSVPIFNAGTVLVLAAYTDSETKITMKDVAGNIIKNPLIIGIAAGVAFVAVGLRLPAAVETTMDSIAGMAAPLALICIGGGVVFQGFDKRFKYAMAASVVKVLITPIIFIAAGYSLGFRGIDLAAIMMLGGTPSAIAGYVTVVQMGGDGYTAGTIIVISTAMSAVTLTAFVYFLSVTGMI